ncbi:MAG TPA: hypothetical protein VEK38_00730 [Candidatus Bathyarchaeia archaeon]|nr:hypothetical protein [Candidatus Bathyarchaeia archaeon]
MKKNILMILPALVFLLLTAHASEEKKTSFYFERTALYDDTQKSVFLDNALFKQLVVQAATAQNINKKPFLELLEKAKEINIENQTIALTQKDIHHRLLSYIPAIHNQTLANALVNEKKTYLSFERCLKAEEKNKSTAYLKPIGEIKLNNVLSTFESDTKHHTHISTIFSLLLTAHEPSQYRIRHKVQAQHALINPDKKVVAIYATDRDKQPQLPLDAIDAQGKLMPGWKVETTYIEQAFKTTEQDSL